MTVTSCKTREIPHVTDELLGRALTGFELIVGSVGSTSYAPEERRWAGDDFHFYARASADGEGRAAGEPVTLLRDGEEIASWPGDEILRAGKQQDFYATALVEWTDEVRERLLGG